jgi:hypothetical protein
VISSPKKQGWLHGPLSSPTPWILGVLSPESKWLGHEAKLSPLPVPLPLYSNNMSSLHAQLWHWITLTVHDGSQSGTQTGFSPSTLVSSCHLSFHECSPAPHSFTCHMRLVQNVCWQLQCCVTSSQE